MYEINQILQKLGMSLKEFSEHYEIPYNTVRQWAQGTRKPPAYVIKLLNEKIERKAKGEQLQIFSITEYFCYSETKDGKTGVYRTRYPESIENWKEKTKNQKFRRIETHKITFTQYI